MKCLVCGHNWDTRYNKIPARCPSCHSKIYGTTNYKASEITCFIVTIVYGSDLESEIDIFKGYRDNHLLTNNLGKIFVAFYYILSPWISIPLYYSEIGRTLVRNYLLEPIKKLIH